MKATPIVLAVLLSLAGTAQASYISFETATSTAGAQSSAAAYRDVVNAAMAQAGAHTTQIPVYDGVSNQSVFGGSSSNLAFRATIDFDVSAALAGSWGFRAGVDFGRGGALFLDGVALGFNSNDMWWGGSYANASQAFIFENVSVSAGHHRLQMFGLEGCCDGTQQFQYSIKGANYQNFSSRDALAVPEPAGYALSLAALGALAITSRRRRSLPRGD